MCEERLLSVPEDRVIRVIRVQRVYNSINSCDGASLKRAIGVRFRAAFLAERDDRSLAIEMWPFGVFQRLKFRGDTYQLSSMPCIID